MGGVRSQICTDAGAIIGKFPLLSGLGRGCWRYHQYSSVENKSIDGTSLFDEYLLIYKL